MASEEGSLRALESLMTEFFHSRTTNERKREIEELLNNFAQQMGAWRYCLHFLSNTQNEYIMMYSLTVFENLINKMWLGVPSQEKIEIRSCLPKLLLSKHKTLPYFICNKLCKVIVDIGKQDWPVFYHDFFTNILQLIQSPTLAPLGLILLKTTSEELACPREDLSVTRKEELHKLLLEQVPTVLSLLKGTLETIWDKHSITATTPPSPTSQESGELLRSMFQGPHYSKQLSQPLPLLDQESLQLCSLALACLAHLFSWIPLSSNITLSLLATIFHFARFGCDLHKGKPDPSIYSSVPAPGTGTTPCLESDNAQVKRGSPVDRVQLGVLAMTCVNELVSKNCVPLEFGEYLLRMFQQTFFLLQKLTRENNGNSVKSRLEELDESYVQKFTEFLRQFISVHLKRIESNTLFPTVDFLALLFQYTFNQPTLEGYFSCLDIWAIFLDYLTTKIKSRFTNRDGMLNKYKDVLVLLLREVLNRIQFRCNQSQLEELDDETLDDDQQTEWQLYLHRSLEIVAKVTELLPSHAFSRLYPVLQENLNVYLGLQPFVVHTNAGRRLNITTENDCRRLHCALRDLSSLLQAIGRLGEYFIGVVFATRFNDALTLVERLVEAACYSSQTSVHDLETAVPSVLRPDLIDVHAQSLAALQAYSHWLAQFYSEVQRQNQARFVSLVTTAVDAVAPLISATVPEKLLITSSTWRLMALLAGSTQRPWCWCAEPCPTCSCSPGPACLRASSSGTPAPPATAACWRRSPASTRLLRDGAGPQHGRLGLEEVKAVVRKTLGILRDIVDSISGESTKSRQICYQSLQESVQVSLALLPVFIHQSDVTDEILSFFLTLFRGLRVQMGVPFTEQIIQTFLNMFTREQLAESIMQEGSAGCRVVERFLKILQVVVQEPGQAFKPFLPSIISLCMEQVYPILAEHSSPDVKAELFELLYQLLHHNWRYFFKTSVLASVHRNAPEEPVENEAQFTAAMQAFGQSFLQPDIHIFKQNLSYLESLNSKHKLYHKKLFCTSMLFHFINVLLLVLVRRSHDLLQEEIVLAVYNMASVDFDSFYSAFLPHFLSSCQGVDANQRNVLGCNFKMERDLPSFTQSVHSVVNDLRYYRLCNGSLALGSVKL
ncbi:hypothetical protein SKAU_G00129900 [Synaphobranchus kaupii]|uniref:Importin N-terminal domain-containing protein n=1 Tax=Synaphobranchus kaupii TaxID=118154 RepID=A0A9Q1J288_SYNKA|nr:hypothetical protein SKAU_G00129900 [Synaphobranchus kaupii]